MMIERFEMDVNPRWWSFVERQWDWNESLRNEGPALVRRARRLFRWARRLPTCQIKVEVALVADAMMRRAHFLKIQSL